MSMHDPDVSVRLNPPASETPTVHPPGRKVKKQEDIGEIPQWRLMVRRFKQSRLAVAGFIVLLFMYLVAALAPFITPNDPTLVDTDSKVSAPSQLTWDGGPAVCKSTSKVRGAPFFDVVYKTDCENGYPIAFFGKGYEYKLFGLIPSDRHLMAVESDDKGAKLLLWGADEQGRDVFARTIKGTQISLTIGLLGVGIASLLGAIIGTASGYFGGITDTFVQRIIEIVLSVPTLPLWALAASILPQDMSVEQRFFFMTLVLSLVAWAGLARQVRGKVMSYSQADYVNAARAAGSGHARIILVHLLPNSVSHIVAVSMLAVPAAIIAETTLSFLGIGMLEPAISWGVLLQDAQDIGAMTSYPWLLIPAIAVIITITAYQLFGDGVRDAVDPYG
jgi:peptide/nickel transport system permease protein